MRRLDRCVENSKIFLQNARENNAFLKQIPRHPYENKYCFWNTLSCFGSNSNMHPYFEFFLSGSASIQKPYPAKFINSVLKIVLARHFCILGTAGLNLNSQAQPKPEAAKFESTPFGTFRIRRLSPEGGRGVVVPKVPFIRKRPSLVIFDHFHNVLSSRS